ncbi:MAG: DJ-1/PfpI family protein, partial [Saprospiraceae bacterium]
MKLLASIWLGAALLLSFVPAANAQQKTAFKVAIFLYQGVEVLDFAGPSEVFAATPGFKTYTVTIDGKEVTSQGFVKVTPNYAMDNAPQPDIIVFPGGSSGATADNPEVIAWVKQIIAAGGTGMSVCTGAFVLAKTGLLEGLNVTTHFGSLERLQKELPNSKVLEHTRWIDNGNTLMTAGVSAGIDGALHLVAKLRGLDVAQETAHYMEYEKWQPENGRVDYTNAYLQQLQSKSLRLENGKPVFSLATGTPAPYEGELRNLATGLVAKGDYQTAATVLETTLRWYPESDHSYAQLATVYTKLGRPIPLEEVSFLALFDQGKIDQAYSIYEKTQREFPGWKIFTENAMNQKGYEF